MHSCQGLGAGLRALLQVAVLLVTAAGHDERGTPLAHVARCYWALRNLMGLLQPASPSRALRAGIHAISISRQGAAQRPCGPSCKRHLEEVGTAAINLVMH